MNESNHQPNPPGGMDQTASPTSAGPGQSPAAGPCVFAPIACALRKGAEDARRAAEKAAPRVKETLVKAAYHAAYGVAYAATFQYTVAKILCPEILKTGARQGAREGAAAGERFTARFQRQEPPVITPSAASEQREPGLA